MINSHLSIGARTAIVFAMVSVVCSPDRADAQTQFFGYYNVPVSSTVTFAPTSVNRVVSAFPTSVFPNEIFSTYDNGSTNRQASYVSTSAATFNAGIALSGFTNYTITSATLTVGSVGDSYINSGGQVFRVLTPYNSSSLTWNTQPTNASTVLTTGSSSGSATRYSFNPSVITDWINGTGTANNGLYFSPAVNTTDSAYTSASTVSWSLTLQNPNPVNTGADVAGTIDRLITISNTASATTLNVTSNGSVRYLAIGGGGGGGFGPANQGPGGGGGAAGFLTGTNLSLTTAGVEITVGAGGLGASGASAASGGSGQNTVVTVVGGTTLTAVGGGGGGGWGMAGLSGGSGGGGGANSGAGGSSNASGFNGAAGTSNPSGGGGGAGGAAPVVVGSGDGGIGGSGSTSNITGATVTYAGGGGGSATDRSGVSGTLANGGSGGGGGGGGNSSQGGDATNFGSGGGASGGRSGLRSGNGYQGVVMLRYAAPYYFWDADSTNGGLIGGNGNWSDAKWTLDPTGGAGITTGSFSNTLRAAVFDSTADSTVTVTGTQASAGLFVKQGFVRFDNGGLGRLDLGSRTATISGGRAIFNADLTATGGVNVTNATLGGSGTITGLTTFSGGTHSPGNSPGVQTFASGITYAAPTAVIWELWGNTNSNSPVKFDQIIVSGGTLAFSATTTLNLQFDGGTGFENTVDWTDGFWATSHSGTNGWLLYDVTGPGAVSNFSNLKLATADWMDKAGNPFSMARPGSSFELYQDQVSGDIYVAYAIPEPTSLAVFAVGGAVAVIAWRRRRRLAA